MQNHKNIYFQAPTYEDINLYTGKLRFKCTMCRKVVFRDADHATDRAMKIRERAPETFMRAYFSGKCGHWHLKGKRR